jgi:hypothetical protein
MRSPPSWAKDQERPLLEAAGEKLQDDVRRERLNVRGLIGVHSDRWRAAVELSEEQRARVGVVGLGWWSQ